MIWTFSDGTTVEIGGAIEGATLLAQELRAALPTAWVQVWPYPSSPRRLRADDPAMLEAWLRNELHDRRGSGLKLKSPEDVPPLPAPPWPTVSAPGVVY